MLASACNHSALCENKFFLLILRNSWYTRFFCDGGRADGQSGGIGTRQSGGIGTGQSGGIGTGQSDDVLAPVNKHASTINIGLLTPDLTLRRRKRLHD